MDTETLKKSANQDADIKAALETVQKECAYLFEVETPPPYAPGTGAGKQPPAAPDTLASALREKLANK